MPRNVLIITLDTTRSDHIGAYGYPLDITPNIDALAERGVLFENSYAPMPQTLPSHTTLMTGLAPRQHGALANTFTVDDRLETLADMLGGRGFETAAFVSSLALSHGTGILQGFESYDQPRARFHVGLPAAAEREATEMADIAVEWAEKRSSDRPFFAWVHFFDPHFDHVAPRRYMREVYPLEVRDKVIKPLIGDAPVAMPRLIKDWRGYAAELRYTDAQVGRMLAELEEAGALDNTVIVLSGDHGEGLAEHGIAAHGMAVWEELHKVPLLVVSPTGEHAGTRVSERVGLADVLPTILGMALGQETDPSAGGNDVERGLDLWGLMESGRSVPERPMFLERPHFSEDGFMERTGGRVGQNGIMVAVLMEQYKLVRWPDGGEELYDLERDPDESIDIVDQHPDVHRKLTAMLDGWLARNPAELLGEQEELSQERIDALRALGYLGDG